MNPREIGTIVAAAVLAAPLALGPSVARAESEADAAAFLERKAAEYRAKAAELEREAKTYRAKAADVEGALRALGVPVHPPAAAASEEDEGPAETVPVAATPAGRGPHGGAIARLGEGVGHLELLLDPKTGKLTLYVLEADGRTPVTAEPPTLELKLRMTNSRGETYGFPIEVRSDAGMGPFTGVSPRLIDVDRFEGRIDEIKVKGRVIAGASFRYPEETK